MSPETRRGPAIDVRGLGKQYRIGAEKARYDTLRDTMADAIRAPFRRAASLLRGEATGAAELHETIWALRDVSFSVTEGEVVGVIGKNGAGKSTLLKILSRITEPSEGCVDLYGTVGSLLEVGTGFHPELTGRENVYLNGAILGMSRVEIEQKFDEIVDFAEIRKFIDTPVKHYSSGMYVRLAFSVAAHLDPEILVVDEVLAVGDAAFQRKCLGRMDDVAREGRTVLFVSHNMASIGRLCERVIWLDEGRIRVSGTPETVIPEYLASGSALSGVRRWDEGLSSHGVEDLKIDAVTVTSEAGKPTAQLDVREPFDITIEYRVLNRLPTSRVGILVRTADGITVFDAYDSDEPRYARPREPGSYRSRCTIPGRLLNPGRYFISVNAGVPGSRNLAFGESVLTIDVVDTGAVGSHMSGGRAGVVRPELEWKQERCVPAAESLGA